jgi:tryptophan-rich sensory protein
MRIATLVKTAAAVAAAAATGSVVTRPNSEWYRSLDKPAWQPPQAAFPAVWTSLYAMISFASARALDRMPPPDRSGFWRAYGVNLGLNAGWSVVFFGTRRPRLALLEIAALNASNVALVRRAWRTDRLAGAALLPYLAWTGFATVLNSSITARNSRQAQGDLAVKHGTRGRAGHCTR